MFNKENNGNGRKILISIITLSVVLLLGGVGACWFVFQTSHENAAEEIAADNVLEETIVTTTENGEEISVTAGLLEASSRREEGDIPEEDHYFEFSGKVPAAVGPITGNDPRINIAAAAVAMVNQIRAGQGLGALRMDVNLENCSAVRALECFQKFSHIRPNGSQWYTVNSDIMFGENLAYGYPNAETAVNAWMNSPAHRENILFPGFKSIAISIYEANGVYYWAQEFGY